MSGSGDSTSTLQPGQSIKPNVSLEKGRQLVEELYDVKVESIKELNSYDDNNFYVKGINKDGQQLKYTLKVLNSMDSKKSDHIEAEHLAMQHLYDNGIHCPLPLRNRQGKTFSLETIQNEATDVDNNERKPTEHIVRLLTFVEGDIMYHAPPTPKLLEKAGKYIAKVDLLLQGISLPKLDSHSSVWFLSNVLDLHKFIYVIEKEPAKFSLVSEVLKAYKERVVPALPNLPKGIIHGDFNEQNIIVKKSLTDEGDYDVHGIIDFGDLQNRPYVFEMAVCICYLMLECTKEGVSLDPFEGGRSVLKGYSSVRKVEENELEVLRILVACRLCQSLVMGAYTYSLDPGNEYLLTTAKTGWALLDRVWREKSDEEMMAHWKQAINQ